MQLHYHSFLIFIARSFVVRLLVRVTVCDRSTRSPVVGIVLMCCSALNSPFVVRTYHVDVFRFQDTLDLRQNPKKSVVLVDGEGDALSRFSIPFTRAVGCGEKYLFAWKNLAIFLVKLANADEGVSFETRDLHTPLPGDLEAVQSVHAHPP